MGETLPHSQVELPAWLTVLFALVHSIRALILGKVVPFCRSGTQKILLSGADLLLMTADYSILSDHQSEISFLTNKNITQMLPVESWLPSVISKARPPLSAFSQNSSLGNPHNSSLSWEHSVAFLPQSSKHFENPPTKQYGKIHYSNALPWYQSLFYFVSYCCSKHHDQKQL